MKQKLYALIALILSFILITSCSGSSTELISFLEGNNEKELADLGGRTVYIGVPSIDGDGLVPLPEDTSTKADYQRKLLNNIGNRLHCTIMEAVADFGTLAASIGSYNCKYDMFYTHTGTQIDLIKGGYLYDISQMEGINLSNEAKWGSAQDQRHRTYQGKVFGVKPQNASSSYGSLEGVLHVNDTLIKSFGQPTPKELFEQGEWTFDRFLTYVVEVSDMNAETVTYGMTTYDGQLHQLPLTAIFANGSNLLNENDGAYSFDLAKDPQAATALEWANDVYETGVVTIDDFDDTPAGFFTNGRTSMFLGGAWIGTTNRQGYPLNELTDGFSFMCMPYGPDAVYGETYSSFIFVSNSISVPISSDEYEMSCFLNEYCEELSEEDRLALEEETKTFYFFNPEDYDYVIDMAENAVYTFLYGELNDVRDTVLNALENITMGRTAISEGLTSITDKVESELKNITD